MEPRETRRAQVTSGSGGEVKPTNRLFFSIDAGCVESAVGLAIKVSRGHQHHAGTKVNVLCDPLRVAIDSKRERFRI